eukprot:CAMPEP_0167785904 /NCGR_PEP_ID=MMETSP0111_2-20121227/8484_1 /TAXON_ID=91324 /ORGANISM="Lotharella globosa, Strain CCCM811" /LENGTH=108 /DNA_ID=CAMNT_0007677203 /DNA_START=270 /DNA_END=597 /DNA_ORIENTATION=+
MYYVAHVVLVIVLVTPRVGQPPQPEGSQGSAPERAARENDDRDDDEDEDDDWAGAAAVEGDGGLVAGTVDMFSLFEGRRPWRLTSLDMKRLGSEVDIGANLGEPERGR